MRASRVLGVLVILAVVAGGWPLIAPVSLEAAGPATVDRQPEHPVELIRSNADSILFRVQVEGYDLRQQVVDGRSYDVVQISGFGLGGEPGQPQLPETRVLLGIPLAAEYEVRVSLGDLVTLPGTHDLIPAPRPLRDIDVTPQTLDNPSGLASLTGGEWEYVPDPALYATDTFFPSPVAEVDGAGFVRNQRFVSVWIRPVQYNPASGQLRLYQQVTVEVAFHYPRGRELGVSHSAGAFESLLASTILNYQSAREWRGKEARDGQVDQAWLPPDPGFKMLVDEEGIYQLTRGQLEAVGVPVVTIDPATFKVLNQGAEIPIRVFESAGVLDSLWFHGQGLDTKYTDNNVYWLTYGGDEGLRMVARSAPPSGSIPVSASYSMTVHLEQDAYYRSQLPWTADADHWFWTYTYYPSPVPSRTFNVDATHLVTGTYTGTLTAVAVGFTDLLPDPDHCARFFINDNYVTEHQWNGREEEQVIEAPFPASFLDVSSNELRVDGCATGATYDVIWWDRFELAARRGYVAQDDMLPFDVAEPGWQYELTGFLTNTVEILDVSDVYSTSYLVDYTVELTGTGYTAAFYDLEMVAGGRYLAATRDALKSPLSIVQDTPSNLTDPANQADYVIVAPDEFADDLQPLVDHRAAQGLTVALLDLEDVFDQFRYGVFDPGAIRDLLDYAYYHWSPPEPTYALVVGDGTYDFKDNLGTGDPQVMPPYLAWVDPWMGETAADNQFVTVAGPDPVADILIGRWPAVSAAQVQAMVDKTLAYETAPPSDGWNEQLLFVADNPDPAGEFDDLSDGLIAGYVPAPYVASKIYLGRTCANPLCRTQIINSLNTTSTLFVNYIGHGGNQQWADEALLRVVDIAPLLDNDRWPIILAMTCLEGYFHEPNFPSLGESIVRASGKGAVASWSPTGNGVAHGHDYLDKGFYRAIFLDGVRELGLATLAGKLNLFAAGYSLDQLETYHLFGDPALRVPALDADIQVDKAVEPAGAVLPGDVLTFTLTFTNAGPATAHHVALTDVVPALLISPTVVYSSSAVISQHVGIDFVWTISDLLPHTGGEIRFTAVVSPTAGPDTIVNEAEVSMAEPDTDPSNNVVSVTTGIQLIRSVDLTTSKAGPDEVLPGGILTYTVAWGNLGPMSAPSVYITDTLPVGVEYVGDSSGWSHTEPAPGVIVWQVTPDPVPAGTSETFVVTGQVTTGQELPATLVNQVRIGPEAGDEDVTNNVDDWTTSVLTLPGDKRYIYLPIVVRAYP